MLELLLLAGGLGASFLGVKIYRRRGDAGRRKAARIWASVAGEMAGEFRIVEVLHMPVPAPTQTASSVPTPPAMVRLPQITVRIDGIEVTARVGGNWTFFEAAFALGIGPVFKTTPHALERGDERLVQRALVDARDWRSQPFREATLDSNGEVVSVIMPGLVQDRLKLHAGVELVAAVAASDALALRILKQLPDAVWVESDEDTGYPAVDVSLPERVRIGPRKQSEGVLTAVRTSVRRAMCFELRVDSAGEPADPLPDLVPRTSLRGLADGVLSSNDFTSLKRSLGTVMVRL